MQDIYAFDVGDYGKVGLLRKLARTGLSLGIVWCRTTRGTAGSDGKHVTYLEKRALRECDPELFDAMRGRFDPTRRRISELHSLFDGNTRFHDDVVPAHRTQRQLWLQSAIRRVAGADVVFCDPDNGISFNDAGGVEHVNVQELRQLYNAGHSLVVYHTPDRSGLHREQVAAGINKLREILRVEHAWAAHFHRGSSRAFFVLGQMRHQSKISEARALLAASAWCCRGHFTIVDAPRTAGPLPVESNSYARAG